MRTLSDAELLMVWERGAGQTFADRALCLLAAAFPDAEAGALASLTAGERDERLLGLRRRLFGPRLVGLTNCPACDTRVELTFDTVDLVSAPRAETTEELSLVIDNHEIRFRLPTAGDLAALADSTGSPAPREQLLDRCVLSAKRDQEKVPTASLPPKVVDAVSNRMSEADSLGDIQLSVNCPSCNHAWQAVFDIVSFLWSEMHAWAQRLLFDVHRLAGAYGWSEAEILSLNPLRRRSYL